MPKTRIWQWMMLMLVAVVSMTAAGCSSDDDDDNDGGSDGGSSTLSIVGTWYMDFSDGYYEITFKSNGTGTLKEYDNRDGKVSTDSFEYTYNERNDRLKITYGEDDSVTFTVISLRSGIMVWEDEYGDTYTLTKEGGSNDDDESELSSTAKKLVGTWRYTFSSGYVSLTLKSDGTGTWREYDEYEDDYIDSVSLKWEYDDNAGELTLYAYGDSEVFIVKSVTSSTLKMTDSDGYTETWEKQK